MASSTKSREQTKPKASRVSQKELPRISLKSALRIPEVIKGSFAGKATSPLQIAKALKIKPTSSNWPQLTGAAVGYGLVEGGYAANEISLTTLGGRIVAPTVAGDVDNALREAALVPTVFGGLLKKYANNKLPAKDIGLNVLQAEFNVSSARASEAWDLIVENAKHVNVLTDIEGSPFVDLSGGASGATAGVGMDGGGGDELLVDPPDQMDDPEQNESPELPEEPPTPAAVRVFVAHGKNKAVLAQVKDLLKVGDMEFEVATDEESAAIPVPDKVFDAMRRCNAAIICVTADEDQDTGDGYQVNQNVLIEIGAAYVLYNKQMILLWDSRVKVPSNLQGLYRCQLDGGKLDFDSGLKLQKALATIKGGDAPSQ